MTVRMEALIMCDGKNKGCEEFLDTVTSVAFLRRKARAMGWRVSSGAGGPDLCPKCWNKYQKTSSGGSGS